MTPADRAVAAAVAESTEAVADDEIQAETPSALPPSSPGGTSSASASQQLDNFVRRAAKGAGSYLSSVSSAAQSAAQSAARINPLLPTENSLTPDQRRGEAPSLPPPPPGYPPRSSEPARSDQHCLPTVVQAPSLLPPPPSYPPRSSFTPSWCASKGDVSEFQRLKETISARRDSSRTPPPSPPPSLVDGVTRPTTSLADRLSRLQSPPPSPPGGGERFGAVSMGAAAAPSASARSARARFAEHSRSLTPRSSTTTPSRTDGYAALVEQGASDGTPAPAPSASSALSSAHSSAGGIIDTAVVSVGGLFHRGNRRDRSDPLRAVIRHFYPDEAWSLLTAAVPWLGKQWRHKLMNKCNGDVSQLTQRQLQKLVRPIDVYMWSVLAGDLAIGFELLEVCHEPLRAALLGAHLCASMAEMLPIFHAELTEAAHQHEKWAIRLLDLCEDQEGARIMLTSPSYHWANSVIQLAEKVSMKNFVAHRYCQNLCDMLMLGDINQIDGDQLGGGGCHAMLPPQFIHSPRHDLLVLHAILPIPNLWLKVKQRMPHSDRSNASLLDDLAFYHYYSIPAVKGALRSLLYFLYVLLFAYVTMRPQLEEDWNIAEQLAVLHQTPPSPPLVASRELNAAAGLDAGAAAGVGAGVAAAAGRVLHEAGHHAGRVLKKAKGGGGVAVFDSPEALAIFEASELPLGELTSCEMLLFVWTLSLMLDEWNQVVSAKPGTFELTFWNKYDYVWLLLFMVGFLLRITPDSFIASASMLRRSNSCCALHSLTVMLSISLAFDPSFE